MGIIESLDGKEVISFDAVVCDYEVKLHIGVVDSEKVLAVDIKENDKFIGLAIYYPSDEHFYLKKYESNLKLVNELNSIAGIVLDNNIDVDIQEYKSILNRTLKDDVKYLIDMKKELNKDDYRKKLNIITTLLFKINM